MLHRIHRSWLDPIFWSGRGVPPTTRFDSAGGRFGVLYAGLTLRGTLAETLLRNPQRLMVGMAERAVTAPPNALMHRNNGSKSTQTSNTSARHLPSVSTSPCGCICAASRA
ncbi:RES family NAD+ phosphorylase [Mesorhizobium sp. C280B]|uniref:RES family NAD+ phosphorylase n=1 Tax=Mesorhizobium sp. C280B TaxID=2956828 RepID=UPI002477FA7D|nr:RES family NAD+ phosphorylase [Mesorhizobium sp. LSJC280B00]